jgi:PIN domain nuclease of toxin-antitoxin system
MGEGLVGTLICYLDTQVAIWLAEAKTAKISHKALSYIEKSEILISPMVVLEFEYLREIQRITWSPEQILYKLGAELHATVCDYPFPIIVEIGIQESWTRDPFDRLIVAHARANGRTGLVSKDELIAANYPNTIW